MLLATEITIRLTALGTVLAGGGLLCLAGALISLLREKKAECATQAIFGLFLLFLAYLFRA